MKHHVFILYKDIQDGILKGLPLYGSNSIIQVLLA